MKLSEDTFNELKDIVNKLISIKQNNNLKSLELRIDDDVQRLYVRGDNYYEDFHAARFNHKHLPDTTYKEFLEKK